MKKDKRKLLLPLLLLLLLIGLGGTVAWLTSTDTLVNEFTVGDIKSPTTDPEDPTTPISVTGNLYEKKWDSTATHKLVPGVSFDKEPYVGIGVGSEKSVVYLYVENDFTNKVYFTINSGWVPVTGHVTAAVAGAPANSYTSGLFLYGTDASTPTILDATSADAWTTSLFDEVVVDSTANTADFTANATTNITVKSLVHQAYDATGTTQVPIATIQQAAIDTLE